MQFENTHAIVLTRTNYGEADKIITSLTRHGKKVSIIAKGVRKPKSKLVAGTELFCVADICYTPGKGAMATLTSARIIKQHTQFLDNLDKVGLAYDVVKTVHKHTEDTDGSQYFIILEQLFAALEDPANDVTVVRVWAWMQVLRASGHQLQLQTQTNGESFSEDLLYGFDTENGGFIASNIGKFTPMHIKMLRLAQTQSLAVLMRVQGAQRYMHELAPVIKQFVETTY